MTSETLTRRALRILRSLSLWDRGVYGAVVALFLLGFLGQPVWGLLDPRLPMSEAYLTNTATDPWGRAWVDAPPPSMAESEFSSYSVGPNGVDEQGQGDDVRVVDTVLYGFSHQALSRFEVYRNLGGLCLALSTFLLAAWELGRAMRARLRQPRSASLWVEVKRAGLLAIPFAALGSMAGVALAVRLDEQLRALEGFLLVPPPAAAVGSAVLVSYLAVVWFRLRQPLEAEGETPPAAPAAPAAGP